MKVVDDGTFAVKVYADEGVQQHHLPHFHLVWSTGSAVIALPTLDFIVGQKPPKRAKCLYIEFFDEICNAWNELNPERAI